jgi:dipeptidyl-peptidase 4
VRGRLTAGLLLLAAGCATVPEPPPTAPATAVEESVGFDRLDRLERIEAERARARAGASAEERGPATGPTASRPTTPGPEARTPPRLTAADYRSAEQFLTWNTAPLVRGDVVTPHWIDGGDRFWYRVTVPAGTRFIYVDPAAPVRRPLFDHDRLAGAMSQAADTSFEGRKLPFDTLEFVDGDLQRLAFRVGDRRFECGLADYQCVVGDTVPRQPVSHVPSPDGRWEAFIHDHDLHVRPAGGGDSISLTTDGEEYFGYGYAAPRANQLRRETPWAPYLQWSPDSRRIAVARFDERDVEHFPIYSATSVRPEGYTYPYALPGDSIIPVFDLHVVDVESRTNVRIDEPPQNAQVNGVHGVRQGDWITVDWAPDGSSLYFVHANRGPSRLQLMEADPVTGATRLLARDSSSTFVELNLDIGEPPNWRVVRRGTAGAVGDVDVIWFSQRDGWAHLYRYDGEGSLLNRITEGPWTVATVHRVDPATGTVFFTGRFREEGTDPYYEHLYRVGVDGSGLRRLTPEDADHQVELSPSGRYFVDSRSRLDLPPVTVLRSAADGSVVLELEEADAGELLATGLRAPESFVARGRDGVTRIWGTIYKPRDFDPTKRYPVIDHIYPGPQIITAPKRFFPSNAPGLVYATFGQVQALAELGFIVVHIDHMGTPYRSKAFHDRWFGDMADHGLPDHIAVLQQLGAERPYMDLERVGIFGHSGGAFASTAAILQYPDFFRVAVSTAGNHDNRSYYYGWAERYQGLLERDTIRETDNYESQANYRMADRLQGRLLLMHGDMDDNVHPALTLRLVHALVEANRDFDFLLLPDYDHGVTQDPYVIRRTWDYFVKHLMGKEPPREYLIREPE